MPFVSPSHVVIGTDESYRAGRPGAPDQVAIRGPTVLTLAAPLDEANRSMIDNLYDLLRRHRRPIAQQMTSPIVSDGNEAPNPLPQWCVYGYSSAPISRRGIMYLGWPSMSVWPS